MAEKHNVVRLFSNKPNVDVAEEVTVGRRIIQPSSPVPSPMHVLDLSGKPKVVMAIGLGGAGKTTWCRWLAETVLEGDGQTILAAVDPENRELKDYFNGVFDPQTHDPEGVCLWLEDLLSHCMTEKASAAIDFGGGDTSLGRLISQSPDLVSMMEEAGVSPVAFYFLTPRINDLSPLASLEAAGFKPKATALVLNDGRADPTGWCEDAFSPTMRHSSFRSAVERGAVVLRMPRLIPAKGVEDRRIKFSQARDGICSEGRKVVPLGAFDRARVRDWLLRMDEAFGPVKSWLPL